MVYSPFFQKYILPLVGPKVTASMLSSAKLQKKRNLFEQQRNQLKPRYIRYFHQLDDPYSVLSCQILQTLLQLPNCKVVLYLCHTDSSQTIPEPNRLAKWSIIDSGQLRQYEYANLPLEFDQNWQTPSPNATKLMGAHLLHQLGSAKQLPDGGYIIDQSVMNNLQQTTLDLWRNEKQLDGNGKPADYLEYTKKCNLVRTDLGHYSGAVFHYGNEFFWGLDRIHYLFSYLADLGCNLPNSAANLIPKQPEYPVEIQNLLKLDSIKLAKLAKVELNPSETDNYIQIFTSYRSPYTYIGFNQLLAISVHYDIPICVRYIMPMVMRNTPVPAIKGRYIIHDSKREADALGIDFGRICDPVGLAVERAMRLSDLAAEKNVLLPFTMSFFRGVFTDGISGATDRGMKRIATRAGLKWTDCKQILSKEDNRYWHNKAQNNQKVMFNLNLWGPPSIIYKQHFAWGQDRLWRLSAKIEQERAK